MGTAHAPLLEGSRRPHLATEKMVPETSAPERSVPRTSAPKPTRIAAVSAVLARCTEVDTGARNVDHILNGTLLPEIADHVLSEMAQGEAIAKIKVSAAKNGKFRYRMS